MTQPMTDLDKLAEASWTPEMYSAALDDWARRLRAFIANPSEVTEPAPNYILLERAAASLRALSIMKVGNIGETGRSSTDGEGAR